MNSRRKNSSGRTTLGTARSARSISKRRRSLTYGVCLTFSLCTLKRFSNSRALRDKIEAFIDFLIEGLDLTELVK